MAASKKIKSRNWTTTETNLFVEVLTNKELSFGECLEEKALKRSAKQEILKVFTARITEEEFVEREQQHFLKNGYQMLVVDTKKVTNQLQRNKKGVEENERSPKKWVKFSP